MVTEDDVEEEDGETDLDEEGENGIPRGSIPGIVTPYKRKGLNGKPQPSIRETYNLQLEVRSG